MKKFFKYLGIFLVLIIGLLIAIPFLFKDKLIEIAKDEINSTLNAKVDFGEFDLSIFKSFPNLAFEINNVNVVGVDKFEGDTLAYIKQFNLDVDIMSVMGDNIKVKTINIESPQILAKVLADSSANWDIYISEEDSTIADEDTSESSSYKLALNEFTIHNATIIYEDIPGNINTIIKNFNFELSGDLAEDFSQLDIKTDIEEITVDYEGVKYLKKSKIEFIAGIDADLANNKYTFNENTFKINELELEFDGYTALPNDDDIEMDITYKLKQTQFKSILSLVPAVYLTDFNDVKTSGSLALNGFVKGIYNDTKLPAFDLALIVKNAMFKYPDLPQSAENIAIDLKIENPDGVDDHTKINLKSFHVEMAKNPFDMKMLLTSPVSNPNIVAEFKGKLDLDKLKEIVPLDSMTINGLLTMNLDVAGKMSDLDNEQYENFKANGDISLENFKYTDADFPQGIEISKTEMAFSPQFVDLKSFSSKIGKSDISAVGKIDNMLQYYFNDATLKGSFTVTSNLMDLNEFMSDEETTETTTEETSSEDMSVIEVPKNLDFELISDFKKLIYDNIDITNATGKLLVKEGKVILNAFKMNLLDGSMLMDGEYNTQNIEKPSVDFKMAISNFDIKKSFDTFNTIQKLAPIAESCSGKFSVDLDYKSDLDSKMEPVLNTTNGGGKLKTKSVVIDNSPTFNKLNNALKTDKFKNMRLDNLALVFKIIDGNIEIEPFITKFAGITADVSGKQGVDQSLNYKMDLEMPRSQMGSEANAVLEGLFKKAGQNGVNVEMGSTINIKAFILGTVTNPKIKLDLKDQVNDVVEDVKEQVKEKVKQEIDKAKQEAIRKAEAEKRRLMAEADVKGKQLVAAAEKTASKVKSEAKTAANKVRNEARNQAAALKRKASNPISKRAAEETGKRLIKEADKKASQLEREANTKANNGVSKAKKESDNLKRTASQKGDDLIRKAKNS